MPPIPARPRLMLLLSVLRGGVLAATIPVPRSPFPPLPNGNPQEATSGSFHAMITIYKGDDTDFANLRRLSITIDTDLDLTGFTGKFCFLGDTKTFTTEEIASKTVTFEYTTEETAKFALGQNFGTFHLYDTEGRHAAIHKVLINVTLHPCPCGPGSIGIVIDNVYDYNKLGNLPTLNGVTVQGEKTGADYGLLGIDSMAAFPSPDGFAFLPAGFAQIDGAQTLTYRKCGFVEDPDMGWVWWTSPERYVRNGMDFTEILE